MKKILPLIILISLVSGQMAQAINTSAKDKCKQCCKATCDKCCKTTCAKCCK